MARTRRYIYSLFDGKRIVGGTKRITIGAKRITIKEAKRIAKRCGARCVVDLHTVDERGRLWLQMAVYSDGSVSRI